MPFFLHRIAVGGADPVMMIGPSAGISAFAGYGSGSPVGETGEVKFSALGISGGAYISEDGASHSGIEVGLKGIVLPVNISAGSVDYKPLVVWDGKE